MQTLGSIIMLSLLFLSFFSFSLYFTKSITIFSKIHQF